jgi:hypothetical protein
VGKVAELPAEYFGAPHLDRQVTVVVVLQLLEAIDVFGVRLDGRRGDDHEPVRVKPALGPLVVGRARRAGILVNDARHLVGRHGLDAFHLVERTGGMWLEFDDVQAVLGRRP